MPGLGDEFRAAREARHLSLSDVSEQIHIRSVYLQSIEDEDWSAIAAPVYVRGFLRTYSRFLGLDPEASVERFNAEMGESGMRNEPSSVRQLGTRSGPSPWLWAAIAIAVLLVAFVGYKYYDNQTSDGGGGPAVASTSASPSVASSSAASPSAASTTAASPLPSGASPAPAGSDAASGNASPGPVASDASPSASGADAGKTKTLVVSITQTSWLLVEIDGQKIVEGIYPAGTVKKFHGKSASLRAGNAGGVNITVNGKDLGPLGASGSVVDKTFPLTD
jgi:cytoskeletal protein RodZ